MKKALLPLITLSLIIMILLSGCAATDYNSAEKAMASGDYKAAMDLFNAVPEYKDAASKAKECEAHLIYEEAITAKANKDYESAYTLLKSISTYSVPEALSDEISVSLAETHAELTKSTITDCASCQDSEGICDALTEYLKPDYQYEEINEDVKQFLILSLNEIFQEPVYDDHIMLDELTSAVEESNLLAAFLGNDIATLSKAHDDGRAKAFLSGNWVRMDGTGFNGLRMKIIISDSRSMGIVIDSIKNQTGDYYNENDIKWDNIAILDDTNIAFADYSSKAYGNTSMSIHESVGILDYNGMRIFSHSMIESPDYSYGRDQVLVKEDALIEVTQLSNEDFVLLFDDYIEGTEMKKLAVFEENAVYYANSSTPSFTTARGVTIGSTWNDVIKAYGYGISNYFSTDSDNVHTKIPAEEAALLCEQADEFMEYRFDGKIMRFFFTDGVVTWIIWYQ